MSDDTATDVWGRMFADYHAGVGKPWTIRRDDGHLDEGDCTAAYVEPPLPEAEQDLLGRLKGRVLDIGCGPGRHLLWLQERGVEAVGIDFSPGTVEVARSRGCREVYVMDVAALDFPADSFDGVIMMGNNVGLAGTLEATEELFRILHRMVRTGGLLVGQTRDPLATHDAAHLAYHAANRSRGLPPGRVRIRLEYDGMAGEWFDLLMLEPPALVELLGRTGWDIEEILTGLDGGVTYIAARCRARSERSGETAHAS